MGPIEKINRAIYKKLARKYATTRVSVSTRRETIRRLYAERKIRIASGDIASAKQTLESECLYGLMEQLKLSNAVRFDMETSNLAQQAYMRATLLIAVPEDKGSASE